MPNRRQNAAQRTREKLAFHYTSALDEGDFDVLAAILEAAESDPELERMIVEINAALTAIVPHEQGVIRSGRQQREGDENMTSIPYGYVGEKNKRKRRSVPRGWVMFAAGVAVMLIVILLESVASVPGGTSGPGGRSLGSDGGGSGDGGAFMQQMMATATAIVSEETRRVQEANATVEPFALTATAIIQDVTATAAGILQPVQPTTVPPASGVCYVVVNHPDGAIVYQNPAAESPIIGVLSQSAVAPIRDVTTEALPGEDLITWYFLQADFTMRAVAGWVRSDAVALMQPECDPSMAQPAEANVCYAVTSGGASVSVHSLPTSESRVVGVLVNSGGVMVIDAEQLPNGERWLYISASAPDSTQGWALAANFEEIIPECIAQLSGTGIVPPTPVPPMPITATPFPATLVPPMTPQVQGIEAVLPTVPPPPNVCLITLGEPVDLWMTLGGAPFMTLPADAVLEVVERPQHESGEWLRVNVVINSVRIENAFVWAGDVNESACEALPSPVPGTMTPSPTPFPVTLLPITATPTLAQ